MERKKLKCLLVLLVFSGFSLPSDAKLIPRRDPLDGALDATLIVIMQQHGKDVFTVRETFLGDTTPGQLLELPGFKLMDEDREHPVCCSDKEVPFDENTWILVFLKPASQGKDGWQVAGLGNCYFGFKTPRKPMICG